MKRLITTLAVIMILTGCGTDRRAESEQRLAEAEKKLEEATKALKEAQEAAAGQKASADVVAKAQEQLKASANQLATAAKSAKETAAQVTDKATSDLVRQSAAAEARAEEARRLAEPPKTHTVAAGTSISVRTQNQISTKSNAAGSKFEASLTAPIEVDGYVVAEKGAMVEGVVTASDDGGRVKGKASIALSLTRLKTRDGQVIEIRTSDVAREAQSSTKKDALKIGVATGIGAAIGAIAGGGKGAAIGAGAGAAGGTGVTLATKGDAAVFPAESVLTFRLAAPFTVEESKK